MHTERLLTLANHLKCGNLGHKKFDYSNWNNLLDDHDWYDHQGCGTIGCAIGECPIVFSKDWEFSMFLKKPQLVSTDLEPIDSAIEFFSISKEEALFLFYAKNADRKSIEGNPGPLKPSATKEQAANHIEKFVVFGGIYPKYYRIPKFASKQKVSKIKEIVNI